MGAPKLKKDFLLALLLLFFCANAVQSQSYITALGLRFGSEYGITLQQKVLKKSTLEAILQRTEINKETLLTVLFEQHNSIISKRLNLYLGAGIHSGIEKPLEGEKNEKLFGGTGIAGLEFTAAKLNISVDVKPAYHITHQRFSWDKAISLRYVLLKRKKKKLFNNKKKKKDKEEETFWQKVGLEKKEEKKEEKKTFWEKIGLKKQKEVETPKKPWWKFWETDEEPESAD